MNPLDRQKIGRHAENQACAYLLSLGFILIEKNYRCRHGEIDLIMRDRDDIVFVEVRSRSRKDYGSADESIDKRKRNRIIRAATHFLQKQHWLYKVSSRFDVIAIHYTNGKSQLEWIKNAFLDESDF